MSDAEITTVAGLSDDRLDTIDLCSALKESANSSENAFDPNAPAIQQPPLDMSMLNHSSVSKIHTGYSSDQEIRAEKSRLEELPLASEWPLSRHLPVSHLCVLRTQYSCRETTGIFPEAYAKVQKSTSILSRDKPARWNCDSFLRKCILSPNEFY